MHIDFVKNNQKKGNNKYAEIEKNIFMIVCYP